MQRPNIQCTNCQLYFDSICKEADLFTFSKGEYRNPELINLIDQWLNERIPNHPFQISIHIYNCKNFKKYLTLKEEKKETLSELDILMEKVKKIGTPDEVPFTEEEKVLMSSLGLSL